MTDLVFSSCVELSATALTLKPNTTYVEWRAVGAQLKRIDRACQWWIGDWLNAGEQRWGEMYAQAVDATESAYSTLRISKWVASTIDLLRRREKVSWGAHREIAALPREEQDEALAAPNPKAGQPGGYGLAFEATPGSVEAPTGA